MQCCVLFGGTTAGKGNHQAVGAHVRKPYNRWKNAIETFETHSKSEFHKTSGVIADNFLKIAEGEQSDIMSQLDDGRSQQIQ